MKNSKAKKGELQRPTPHFKFPHEIQISSTKLTDEECKWHGVKEGTFKLKVDNYGWFPKDVLMGVLDRMYSDTNKIGAQTGQNFGTMGMGVIDVEKAISMLKNNGYQIIS